MQPENEFTQFKSNVASSRAAHAGFQATSKKKDRAEELVHFANDFFRQRPHVACPKEIKPVLQALAAKPGVPSADTLEVDMPDAPPRERSTAPKRAWPEGRQEREGDRRPARSRSPHQLEDATAPYLVETENLPFQLLNVDIMEVGKNLPDTQKAVSEFMEHEKVLEVDFPSAS